MDTLPVKAAVPYQAKRVGPDEGQSFWTVTLTKDGVQRPTIPGLRSRSRCQRVSMN